MDECKLFLNGNLVPFSSLSTKHLAFCSVPQPSWQPEPGDLPEYRYIYADIAKRLLAERQQDRGV